MEISPPTIQLNSIRVGSYELDLDDQQLNSETPYDQPIIASFSASLDTTSLKNSVTLQSVSGESYSLNFSFQDNYKTFSATPSTNLSSMDNFQLEIANTLRGNDGEVFPGVVVDFSTKPGTMNITSLLMSGKEVINNSRITDIPLVGTIEIMFSKPVDPDYMSGDYFKILGIQNIPLSILLSEDKKKVTLTISQPLRHLTRYRLWISGDITGLNGESFTQMNRYFYSAINTEPVLPVISDEDLLTLVQQQTFKYFWDFAEPVSGMARERNISGSLVTTGGSGFGVMAIIVAIERGFITRQQGIDRLSQILNFLETADRFHGVWSHWLDGTTGSVIPFGTEDDGGDLVETSFMIQGLLTFRQYLNSNVLQENDLITRINMLWEEVEWDWFTQGGQNVLYWHWSPNHGWNMNHQIRGHNETLITYFLAAASPTHAIDASAYHLGYAINGDIVNGNSYYNIILPLGQAYGGPLFFSHYSFLGLDPRNLRDTYCSDYFLQNANHTLINQAYCLDNPKDFVGYSDLNWGLTASDNQIGYSAHSPTNDLGVITPTAALSSFPYAPEQSMKALKFFYYNLGDRLWGPYGFYDAYNITEGWTATSTIAIDQGPIIIMIENYRTGLLWDLFMSAPEVQTAMNKLDFTN